MSDPKFKTKRNRLTAYALACGYIERTTDKNTTTTLWMEHTCFHVRKHNHQTGKRLCWDTFDKVSAARNHFDKMRRV